MKLRKLLMMAIATTTLLTLVACSNIEEQKQPTNPTETPSESPTQTPTPEPDNSTETEPIKVIVYEDANIILEDLDGELTVTTADGVIAGGFYDDTLVNVSVENNELVIGAVSPGITSIGFECTIEDLKFVYYVDITIDSNLTMLAAVRMDNDGAADFNPTAVEKDLVEIFETVYTTIPEDSHPFVETMAVNTADPDSMTYYFGVSEFVGLDSAAVSEPMMSSVAYSLCVLKFDTNENANAALPLLEEHAPVRKWVCVEAEKVSARVVKDTYVVFVMSSVETVDLIDAVVIE